MGRTNFSHRSKQTELMDTESVTFEEFHQCLRQLEFINVCTLAYRPTLQWLQHMWGKEPSGKPFLILDAGSGGGDMLRRIWALSRKCGIKVNLVGADLNPWSSKSAQMSSPLDMPAKFETANIFSLPFARDPDFIISSLFTHHLTNNELIDFLRWMDKKAVRGWLINDLHRHPIAFYFIKYVTRLVSSNKLIRHDAPVSVARAFTRSEWITLLSKAGIQPDRIKIHWYFPFRYVVACQK